MCPEKVMGWTGVRVGGKQNLGGLEEFMRTSFLSVVFRPDLFTPAIQRCLPHMCGPWSVGLRISDITWQLVCKITSIQWTILVVCGITNVCPVYECLIYQQNCRIRRRAAFMQCLVAISSRFSISSELSILSHPFNFLTFVKMISL